MQILLAFRASTKGLEYSALQDSSFLSVWPASPISPDAQDAVNTSIRKLRSAICELRLLMSPRSVSLSGAYLLQLSLFQVFPLQFLQSCKLFSCMKFNKVTMFGNHSDYLLFPNSFQEWYSTDSQWRLHLSRLVSSSVLRASSGMPFGSGTSHRSLDVVQLALFFMLVWFGTFSYISASGMCSVLVRGSLFRSFKEYFF